MTVHFPGFIQALQSVFQIFIFFIMVFSYFSIVTSDRKCVIGLLIYHIVVKTYYKINCQTKSDNQAGNLEYVIRNRKEDNIIKRRHKQFYKEYL